MAKKKDTVEEKLVKLKDIFNSDVVITLGVQKKDGKIDLLNCEKSFHLDAEEGQQPPSKRLLDKSFPSYLG